MASIREVLVNAKSRMVTHSGFGGVWNESNVHVVTGPRRLVAEDHQIATVSAGAYTGVDGRLLRGRLRVTVWVRGYEDMRNDETVIVTGTDGVVERLRDVVRYMGYSWLNGALDEPLVVEAISSPARDETSADNGLVTGYAEFSFGLYPGIPFQAALDTGSDVDRGAAL